MGIDAESRRPHRRRARPGPRTVQQRSAGTRRSTTAALIRRRGNASCFHFRASSTTSGRSRPPSMPRIAEVKSAASRRRSADSQAVARRSARNTVASARDGRELEPSDHECDQRRGSASGAPAAARCRARPRHDPRADEHERGHEVARLGAHDGSLGARGQADRQGADHPQRRADCQDPAGGEEHRGGRYTPRHAPAAPARADR